MEGKNLPERKISTQWSRSENTIRAIFNFIDLYDRLPQRQDKRRVAILGAGAAVEVAPLRESLIKKDGEEPEIIAFDLDPAMKRLTEATIGADIPGFTYKTANFALPEVFPSDQQLDLIIIRNPNIHAYPDSWATGINNALEHLRIGGILLFTTNEVHAREFIQKEMEKGGRGDYYETKLQEIPIVINVLPYVVEQDIFLAKKISEVGV